ncbi:XVIPCD domain-containing protein [Luteibacter sp.]|uniref:XVIPCD domain-containing protein n=1 Tax=Luteibacter sp. TaxID=1886636 RepID=UPI003F809713
MNQRTDEYANLSAASYREDLRIGDDVQTSGRHFVVVDSAASLITGFSATTFREKDGQDMVIAFRGTDDPFDSVVDGIMVGQRVNLQAIESEIYTANTLRRAVPRGTSLDAGDVVTVTGHSLGGGLAQLNAEKFGLHGETFNAYGIVGLIGHEKSGGGQMINHVRATDVVSAASEHFGEVRVYATTPDIEALKAAGYGAPGAHGVGRMLAGADIGAHYMANFDKAPDNPSIVNDVAAKRYENNKELVDAFRGDILAHRTTLTSNLTEPALIGARAMRGSAEAMATTMAGQALYTAGEAIHGAQMARDAGNSLLDATRAAMHRVSERFSDPATANALGTATYGAPIPTPPSNDSDIRRADHPGHELFTQAYRGASAVDKDLGRKPDENTQKLAGALAVAAARDGLKQINHVVLNDDGSKAYAVQGELNSPHKKYVEVSTHQAISTPLEQSSQRWTAAAAAHQQEAQTQQATQAQNQVQQASMRPHGP